MLVEEIMTPKEKLVTVSPMAPVRDVLMIMKKDGIRSVVVEKTSENGAYGLVTVKDVLQSIIAEDGDIDFLNVFDIASIPSISVSKKLDIKYASIMMVKNNIECLLVIDNNELYGVLTISDIIGIMLNEID
ncbi:MAG TPA: CBS domain-containing protein [Nautiliaceae bacterium]|nr:CBS domain-containing protein [Nautiliaceae bacterium]